MGFIVGRDRKEGKAALAKLLFPAALDDISEEAIPWCIEIRFQRVNEPQRCRHQTALPDFLLERFLIDFFRADSLDVRSERVATCNAPRVVRRSPKDAALLSAHERSLLLTTRHGGFHIQNLLTGGVHILHRSRACMVFLCLWYVGAVVCFSASLCIQRVVTSLFIFRHFDFTR